MQRNDFRFIHRGKPLYDLSAEETHLLAPIHKANKKRQKALLLLHGFGSSPAVFRYLLPKITAYDALVCPLLPGHGTSLADFAEVKAETWLSSCREAYEALVAEYQTVDILGLSLGGLLACELSKEYAIHHLYLLAPALKLHQKVDRLLSITKIAQVLGFKEIRNEAGNIASPLQAELTYRKLPLSTIHEILTFHQNYQWVAPSCAVDLFLGSQDEVVASKEVALLFENHPHSTIHWLQDSAHVLPLDKDWQAIAECINSQAT